MTTKTKEAPKRAYRCAICGIGLRDQQWVYSHSTGERYCPPQEWEACSARTEKRK